MTENKRYSFNWERGHPNFWDNHCDLADCYLTCEDVVKLLNELHDKNELFRQNMEEYRKLSLQFERRNNELISDNAFLEKENEQLKSTVKEVNELLSEEVDVFSDKATEHDINAYIELKELDNKDAYYMATATKKAINLLNEVVDD